MISRIKRKIASFLRGYMGKDILDEPKYGRKNILLMYWHYPSREHTERLKKIAPDFDIVLATSEKIAIKAAPFSEIILGNTYLEQSILYAKNLKWVQTTAGGLDHVPADELKRKRILLSRSTISSKVIARHAYTLAWALVRKLPTSFSFQVQHKWGSGIDFIPEPRNALIIGFGAIGKELSRLLRKDGIRVWGVKRNLDKESKAMCDKLYNSSSWRETLPQVDLCFLVLPLNKDTKNFMDESTLKSLPKHAIVINVGRGATLDEKALVKLLKEGRLGGAGLDVLSVVPPKPDDEIWNTPNLIITPHVAAYYSGREGDIESFFEKQLASYMKGEPLLNVIDWDKI